MTMADRLRHITESEIVAAAKVLWARHGAMSPSWDSADARYLRWKRECMELAYEILKAARGAKDGE